MRVRISKTARHNGIPTAYVVKVKGIKFPRRIKEWYFPADKKPETAIKMALNDYENYLRDTM
jgi:hypothetical protein|tara:strand:- start:36 stop:221 length:186 start_codon:yes stop_codon:yes gene_type:complete